MDPLILVPIFLSIVWVSAILLTSNPGHRKLPPGPYPYPLIGNIFALGSKPHKSLAKLSRKYGPVMSLKLGNITTVVVSSPETAKIVLHKHDLLFSDRTIPTAAEAQDHDKFSIGWLPAQNQWRKLRKVSKEHMFSVARLDASQGLRREKLQKLSDYLRECSETGRVVDIGAAVITTSLNLMSATLFSVEFAQFDSDSSQEMKEVLLGVTKCLGSLNIADLFPLLKSFDPQGSKKQLEILFAKLLAILDGIIDAKMQSKGEKKDLMDNLIDLSKKGDAELSINDIKHLLMDLFIAGTDTTASTVEWAMSELLRNPEKLLKVRDEIIDVIKENGHLKESNIAGFSYLQAVVKETLRLHPPAPFLVPHRARSDVEIMGYIVPKSAQVFVNVWATGRDPTVWTNADSFLPERFLNGSAHIDFRGKNFELIPFGAGRRMCPGMPLAHRMVHLLLATLVGKFDWKVEGKPEELDMDDKYGLTLHKTMPLKAIPTLL